METAATHRASASSLVANQLSSSAVRFRGSATSYQSSSNSSTNNNHGAATTTAIDQSNGNGSDRIVLVRYYLDRPGYDLSNSSSRIWINPPIPETKPTDILKFLHEEGIKPYNDKNLLVELYLDTYQSFMLLEACNDHSIYFDYSDATSTHPGILNIRLTDLNDALTSANNNNNGSSGAGAAASNAVPRCNTSPVGLFAFAMTVGLDALNVLRELLEGQSTAITASYLLIYSPYAFFISGLLQFVVGLNEISRNNIYGATAFLGFGCFWLANGTSLILTTYFSEQIPDHISSASASATATFVRECYIMLFACALLKQTLVMNKLTTALISTLIVYLLAASLAGWHDAFAWMKMALGFVLSIFGLYLFYAELTNEVYHRAVFNLYPWTANSSEEAFGAAGRSNGLRTMAIDLRTAGHHNVLLQSISAGTAATDNTYSASKNKDPSAYHLRDVRPDKNM